MSREVLELFNKIAVGLPPQDGIAFNSTFFEHISRKNKNIRDSLKSIKHFFGFFLRSAFGKKISIEALNINKVDVIVTYSSRKPNVYPVMSDLARGIAAKGYKVIEVSPWDLTYFSGGDKDELTSLTGSYLFGGLGLFQATNILRLTIIGLMRAQVLGRRIDKHLSQREFSISNLIVILGFYYRSRYFLRKLDPLSALSVIPVIITNGEHVAFNYCLLSILKNARNRVCLYSDLVTEISTQPLSTHIWTINPWVEDELRFLSSSLIANGQSIKYIGYPEFDYAKNLDSEADFYGPTCNIPLLYISDYTPGVTDDGSATEDEVNLLMQFLTISPSYSVFYKLRPNVSAEDFKLPFSNGETRGRFNVIDGKVPLRDLINSKILKYVGCRKSTAIFLAIAFGKVVFRVKTSVNDDVGFPVALDNLVPSITSAKELSSLLLNPGNINQYDRQRAQTQETALNSMCEIVDGMLSCQH